MKKSSLEKQSSAVSHLVWGYVFDGSTGREIAIREFDARVTWDLIDVSMFMLAYQELREENRDLKMEHQKLEQELQAARACQSDPEPVIELRDISRKQAKKEISVYFKENDGREIWPDEIVERLRIDMEMVLNICEELEREKKIAAL